MLLFVNWKINRRYRASAGLQYCCIKSCATSCCVLCLSSLDEPARFFLRACKTFASCIYVFSAAPWLYKTKVNVKEFLALPWNIHRAKLVGRALAWTCFHLKVRTSVHQSLTVNPHPANWPISARQIFLFAIKFLGRSQKDKGAQAPPIR